MLAAYQSGSVGTTVSVQGGLGPPISFDGLAQATSSLVDHARHQADLKRLYYETQDARLELLVAQFDLQLALATMPDQDIPGLLSLGNSAVAQETMLAEIMRISEAWSARKLELQRRLANNKYLLSRIATPRHGREPQPFGIELDLDSKFESPWKEKRAALVDEDAQVQTSICLSETVVDKAEIEMIEASLEKLSITHEHVSLGALSFESQSGIELQVASFSLPPSESLEGYQVLEASIRGNRTDELVKELCESFTAAPGPSQSKAGFYPDEFAYCAALLEMAELSGVDVTLNKGQATSNALQDVLEKLAGDWFGVELSQPGDYSVESSTQSQ